MFMILIVKLVSIIMIVDGCLLLLKPKMLKKMIDFISEGNRVYIAAGLKVLLGVIMMLAASECRVSWFVLFIGALVVLSSIVLFFLKKKFVLDLLEKIKNLPRKKVFLLGVIALGLGVLLILSI